MTSRKYLFGALVLFSLLSGLVSGAVAADAPEIKKVGEVIADVVQGGCEICGTTGLAVKYSGGKSAACSTAQKCTITAKELESKYNAVAINFDVKTASACGDKVCIYNGETVVTNPPAIIDDKTNFIIKGWRSDTLKQLKAVSGTALTMRLCKDSCPTADHGKTCSPAFPVVFDFSKGQDKVAETTAGASFANCRLTLASTISSASADTTSKLRAALKDKLAATFSGCTPSYKTASFYIREKGSGETGIILESKLAITGFTDTYFKTGESGMLPGSAADLMSGTYEIYAKACADASCKSSVTSDAVAIAITGKEKENMYVSEILSGEGTSYSKLLSFNETAENDVAKGTLSGELKTLRIKLNGLDKTSDLYLAIGDTCEGIKAKTSKTGRENFFTKVGQVAGKTPEVLGSTAKSAWAWAKSWVPQALEKLWDFGKKVYSGIKGIAGEIKKGWNSTGQEIIVASSDDEGVKEITQEAKIDVKDASSGRTTTEQETKVIRMQDMKTGHIYPVSSILVVDDEYYVEIEKIDGGAVSAKNGKTLVFSACQFHENDILDGVSLFPEYTDSASVYLGIGVEPGNPEVLDLATKQIVEGKIPSEEAKKEYNPVPKPKCECTTVLCWLSCMDRYFSDAVFWAG